MTTLLDYDKKELLAMLSGLDIPSYRVDQIINAVYNGKDYEDNINLPKDLLAKLQEYGYIMQPIKIRKAIESKGKDKTIKFLYDLQDGNIIEGVLMKYAFGNTLCVSTQVGCKMNCAFCASGLNGFVRNLSAGEILGQIVAVNKYLGGSIKNREITNVVLMGSGEPLDNFDNLKKFLRLVTADDYLNISVRNISVSTCGIPSKIEQLADLGYAVTLCLSLHAPNDMIRNQIMPISRRYSIREVMEALKYYHTRTNRRIIIEYTLIDGVNNSMANAKELSMVLNNIPCHVNLIKLNEVEGRNLKAPSADSCKRFTDNLNRFGVSATLRRTLGDDIEGACGMLRNKEIVGNQVVIKENDFKNTRPSPNENTLRKVKDASMLLANKNKKDTKSSIVRKDTKSSNYKKDTKNYGVSKDNKQSKSSGYRKDGQRRNVNKPMRNNKGDRSNRNYN